MSNPLERKGLEACE